MSPHMNYMNLHWTTIYIFEEILFTFNQLVARSFLLDILNIVNLNVEHLYLLFYNWKYTNFSWSIFLKNVLILFKDTVTDV